MLLSQTDTAKHRTRTRACWNLESLGRQVTCAGRGGSSSGRTSRWTVRTCGEPRWPRPTSRRTSWSSGASPCPYGWVRRRTRCWAPRRGRPPCRRSAPRRVRSRAPAGTPWRCASSRRPRSPGGSCRRRLWWTGRSGRARRPPSRWGYPPATRAPRTTGGSHRIFPELASLFSVCAAQALRYQGTGEYSKERELSRLVIHRPWDWQKTGDIVIFPQNVEQKSRGWAISFSFFV